MRKLKADEIEVRVAQVGAKGCQVLLYKTSRVDMAILDEEFGVMNWTCDYKEVKGNMYCGIGIRKDENAPFVWKWDCGIESNTEAEKGEASDSFKRAGFKVGIGRELYSAPFCWLNVETEQQNGKWVLKDRFEKFSVNEIAYKEDGTIGSLVIESNKRGVIFTFGKYIAPKKADVKPIVIKARAFYKQLEVVESIDEKSMLYIETLNCLEELKKQKEENIAKKLNELLLKKIVEK